MSNNIDASYILKLMELSQALSPDKKVWWKKKLPEMNEFQRSQFVSILEKEAKSKVKVLQKNIALRKHYAQKKVKALYNYVENKVAKDEEIELALLDKELENV